jgi:hypothetical protein
MVATRAQVDLLDDYFLSYGLDPDTGYRPQDVLAKQPDRVVAAAADEREAVAHG